MNRVFFALLFAGIVSVPLHADEPDPIRKEVDKARAARAEAEAKAAAGLNAALDEAIKTVAGLGDLDGVKTLQAEKKAFQESGKLPESLKIRIAASEYQKAIKAAQATLEKTYEQAIKDATKALKIEQAEAFRTEMKALQPSRTGIAGEKDDLAVKGKWVAGTYNITYHPTHTTRTYVVRPNGEVAIVELKVKAMLKPFLGGGSFTLDFGEGIAAERVTFADGRMFIEHFNPKSDLGKNPPAQIGIGEPAKKK
jgi:hypothetical protein